MAIFEIEILSEFAPAASVITPDEMKNMFLQGIHICFPNGDTLTNPQIKEMVDLYQDQLALAFDLAFFPTVVDARYEYDTRAGLNYTFTKVNYMVRQVFSYNLGAGPVNLYEIPTQWVTTENFDNLFQKFPRIFYLLPYLSAATGAYFIPIWQSLLTQAGAIYPPRNSYIPGGVHVVYLTGFNPVPQFVSKMVGLLVAMNIISKLSIFIGAVGMVSGSISVDGLSESWTKDTSSKFGPMGPTLMYLNSEYQNMMNTFRGKYGRNLTFAKM